MGFPKEIYDRAAAVLADRRQRAREQSQRHRQEIYRLLPQIEQIDSQLRQVGMKTIQAWRARRTIWSRSSSGSRPRVLHCKSSGTTCWRRRGCWKFTATTATLQKVSGHRLCRRAEMRVLQKLLRQAAFDALGAAHPQDCRFSNFSLDYYSVQPLPTGWCRGKRWRWSKTTAPPTRGISDRPLSPHRAAQPAFSGQHRPWQDPPVAGHRRAGDRKGLRRGVRLGAEPAGQAGKRRSSASTPRTRTSRATCRWCWSAIF